MATRELRVQLVGDPTQLQAAFGKAGASASLLERKFGTVGAAANRVGTQMATLARRAALPAAAIGVLSVKSFVDFDRAMTKSTAIMDDVSEKMRGDMVDAARVVGKETQFSATQAAESYFFLASAGLDAQQSLKAMPQVAKFATAGNFDLATATDLVTDAQSALGLTVEKTQKNMRNMGRVSDVLTKANTLANATIQQFSESLTNKGAAALRILNKDMEEGVAVLAAYADQGVKGAKAGTALSIILRDLQKSALANEEAFKEAGVEVFNAKGEFNNIGEVIADLEDRFEGMSDEQKKAELTTLGFQEKSQQFLLTLLGTSDAIAEYEKGLRGAEGTTDRVAEKSMEGFAGSVERLKGQVQDVGLEIGERLAPTLQELAEILGDDQISASEKFEQALDIVAEKLSDLAPKAASAGVKVGIKFGEGVLKGIGNADALGKLFIGAGLIRIFGGRGAILKSGAVVGSTLGIGMASGAAATAGGGAAAAGASAGIGGAVGSALKKVKWARVGMLAAGVAAADVFVQEFANRAKQGSADIAEAIRAETSDPVSDIAGKIFGEPDLNRTGREAAELLDEMAEGRVKISAIQSEQLQKGIAELELTNEQADAVNDINRLVAEGRELDIGVKLGMNPERLAKITEGLDFLRSGVGASLGDIERVTERTSRVISQELGSKSEDGRRKMAENFDAAADAIFQSMRRGEIDLKEGTERWAELIREADVVNASRAKGRELAQEWAKGMDETGEATKDGVKQMLDELQAMPAPARIAAFRTWQGVLKEAVEKGDLSQEEFRKLRSNALGKEGLGGLRDKAPLTAAQAVGGIWQNFSSLVDATGGGMETIVSNVTSALSAFGIADKIKFVAKRVAASPAARAIATGAKKQQGGPLTIPGSGTGDVVPMLAPEGSFVLNRNAAEALGFQGGGMVPFVGEPREVVFPPGTVTQGIVAANEAFPRFQEGGFPELEPAARALANQLAGKGFVPTSTFRPTSTTHHGRGEAIDYGDSVNNLRHLWPMLRSQTAGLAELFGPSYLPAPTLFKHGVPFSDSGLQSTHEDHIHVAITSAIGKLGRALDTQIAKMRLEGPAGPLRSLGQGALDRTHKAGTQHLDKQLAASSSRRQVGGFVGMQKGGRVSLGKLDSGSLLDLISLQVSLAESTEGTADDIEALTDRLGVLGKESRRTHKQLGELTKGPLLGKRDRREIQREIKDRDLSAKGERKLRKQLSQRARKEERRDRRQERADLISDSTSQIEDMRRTREDIANKIRDELGAAIEAENEAILDTFDETTESLLEGIPQAAELEALQEKDEQVKDEAERGALVDELERIKKSGSAKLIAEKEAELAAFDRAEKIEELEEELADEQERIQEERAERREELEDELEKKKRERIKKSVDNATDAIDKEINHLTNALERMVDRLTKPRGGKGKGGGGKRKKRAHGGPVDPGEAFLVGEEGEELFVPPGAGRIRSHRDTERMVGGDTNIYVTATGAVANDPHMLANNIAWQLQTRRRLAGVS